MPPTSANRGETNKNIKATTTALEPSEKRTVEGARKKNKREAFIHSVKIIVKYYVLVGCAIKKK